MAKDTDLEAAAEALFSPDDEALQCTVVAAYYIPNCSLELDEGQEDRQEVADLFASFLFPSLIVMECVQSENRVH